MSSATYLRDRVNQFVNSEQFIQFANDCLIQSGVDTQMTQDEKVALVREGILLTYKLSPHVDRIVQEAIDRKGQAGVRRGLEKALLTLPFCQNPVCPKDKLTKMFKCARCQINRYCSKECQRAHWPLHKKVCRKSTGAQNRPAQAQSPRASSTSSRQ